MSIETLGSAEPTIPASINELMATGQYATVAEAAKAQSEQIQAFQAGRMALLGIDADDLHKMKFPR